MNPLDEISKDLYANLINQLDDYFLKGLERKGYTFKTIPERNEFIKTRCRCEDSLRLQQKTYFVDDVPFIMWKYPKNIDLKWEHGKDITVSAEYGSFYYL